MILVRLTEFDCKQFCSYRCTFDDAGVQASKWSLKCWSVNLWLDMVPPARTQSRYVNNFFCVIILIKSLFSFHIINTGTRR